MKTKVKRMSKRTLALFLGILMLVTSIGMGSLITADAWDTNNDQIYIKIGTGGWTAYKLNSDGYANFTIGVGCYCQWVFFGNYNGVHSYRLKGGEDQPNGTMGDSTKYWARRTTNDTGGTGDQDYYTYLPAGEYVVKFDDLQEYHLGYYFYRKNISVYGAVTSTSWSSTNLNMTYNGSAYCYTVPGNGEQKRFRVLVEDKHYQPSSASDDISDNTDYASGYTAEQAPSNWNNYFYFNTEKYYNYHIWVQSGKVWLTKSYKDFYLTGYFNGNNVSAKSDDFKFSETSTPGVFELDCTFTTSDQYVTIFDGDYAYHASSLNGGSGTTYTSIDSSPNNDNKWHITNTANTELRLTWNMNDKTLSWEVPRDHYYLTGWLNGAAETGNTHAFTNTSGTTWTYSFTPSGDQGGYQYMTIKKSDGTVYHPGTHGSGSGTASASTDTDASADNKWKVKATSGQTVNLTWDSSTNVLSWTVSGGSSGGSSHGTLAPNAKVLYGVNDNGLPNTANIDVYLDNGVYYANLESLISLFKEQTNCYVAISTDGTKANIISSQTVTVDTNTSYCTSYGYQEHYLGTNTAHYFPRVSGMKNTTKGFTITASSASGYSIVLSGSEIIDGGDEVSSVKIYAKDGAAPIDWSNKTSGGASSTSGTAYNYAAIATTAITKIDDAAATGVTTNNVGDSSSQYQSATVEVGKKLTITTTISSSNSWSSKYYVKGWCINGVTYKCDGTVGVNTASDTSTGVCTLNYTIPEEVDVNYLEITPIYYLRDNSNCITFYLEGYNTVQNKWGNTPYIYPFYGNNDNVDNSFGCYPGQPMVYTDGKYSIEIPLASNNILNANNKNGTAIKGITINNGYADHVHRNMIYGWTAHDNDADHKQTYDYDDFYKIYNECLKDGSEHPNSIIFRIQDEETVFNRATYGGGTKSGQFASGVSDIDISAIASSGNGWELLTNRYEEAVNIFGSTSGIQNPNSGVTPANDTQNAIYVVSTGYNANIAGDYGTMWKIYDGSGQLISKDTTNSRYGIPPSVLVMQGSDSGITNKTGTYPDASHNVDGVGSYTDKISKYETIYKTLKGSSYVNKRVYITYEKDAQDTRSDTNGTGAYRLDGRWYYTHASDNVQSTIGIEYYDKSSAKWKTDTVTASTGVGSTSGCTAKFNSGSYLDDSHQTTSSSVLINAKDKWNFTAVAGTGYIFDSWQIKYSATSYDKIEGAGESASIDATANYTLVARFVPIVTGDLTIDHTLASSSTGEGTVDMTVLVKNGNSEIARYNGSHIYIENYISNTNSGYTIDVTLKTTPEYDGKVSAFGYDKFNTNKNITATTSPATLPGNENTLTTSHFTFTVGDLYAGTTLVTDTLAYTSTITETPHYYNFVYNLTTRGSSTANNKSYTSKGKISQKDYKAYVTNQASHTLDPSFVTAKAPFESNFLKSNSLTPGTISYTSGTHTFAATSSFAQSDSTPVHHVVFKLPYDYYNESSGTSYKKYNASNATDRDSYKASKAVFDLAANYNSFITIGATSIEPGSQSKVSKVTDSTDVNHTGNDFITAPDELRLDGNKMYFKYWEISKLNNEVDKGVAFAKVYYPDFHYRIYGDYYVEAVYGDSPADSWKMKYSEDATNKAASIMYIGSSRNQWNSGLEGETDDQTKASDIIYNDFIFNFADKGAELKGSSNKIGMVIERVSTTEAPSKTSWAVGKANVSDMNSYKETYGGTEADRSSRILNWLKGTSSAPTGCVKIEYSTTDLNNKNFMEKCYTAYSASGQKIDSEDGNAISFKNDNTLDDYVYRAYAYMKCSDNTYVLSEPAYFCMKYTSSKKQFENE